MAHINEIKLRMKSIKETRQITRAMKFISAAKLKRARNQLEHTIPYFEKVKSIMADILLHSGKVDSIFFDVRAERECKKKAFLVITGDKGFAGGYNHNIIKFVEEHIENKKDVLLFVAGNVGKYYFAKNQYDVYMEFDYPVQNPTIYRAREIAELIMKLFSEGVFDEMYIAFTNMLSSVNSKPEIMKLLPLDYNALKQNLNIKEELDEDPEDILDYEPDPQTVFDLLVRKYLKGIIYGAFVEAFTSEQSARMIAMDNATSNADEMLRKLELAYNRARQAKITEEISEIVGGAEVIR